jgi:hypothetical protein
LALGSIYEVTRLVADLLSLLIRHADDAPETRASDPLAATPHLLLFLRLRGLRAWFAGGSALLRRGRTGRAGFIRSVRRTRRSLKQYNEQQVDHGGSIDECTFVSAVCRAKKAAGPGPAAIFEIIDLS